VILRHSPIDLASIVRVTQPWNPPAHYGIDYSCVVGTPIYAAADGVVHCGTDPAGFGTYVRIDTGTHLVYAAHLWTVAVREGQQVTAGQVIGTSGNTGNSTGPHLHFEVRDKSGSPWRYGAVDPGLWLMEDGGDVLTTLHCQRHGTWQNLWARDVGAGWIKIVNPPTGRVLYPDVPHVLVRFWTDDRDAAYIREGRAGGSRFVREMRDQWLSVPDATAWELANEPDCNSNEGLAQLNEYTIGALEQAAVYGLKLCVLNLPEGNPSGDEAAIRWKWQQLLPCIKRAVQGGHYIGLHAYWRPGVEGPTGRYHALGRRASDIVAWRELGITGARVLINECGIDGGIAGNPPREGWRALSDADTYRAEIVEAERYARTIPGVDALMLFTADYLGEWGSYDVDETFARSLIAPLRMLNAPIEEAPVTSTELDAARTRLGRLPATQKAADARGYVWRDEWFADGFFYALAWAPVPQRYHVLKLETRGWTVIEDSAL
jgi:hypothetical protein